MSQDNAVRNAAHKSAVSDILQARRQALQWLARMNVARGIDWDSPIVRGNQTQYEQHPQRPAHGYLLLYAQNVGNKSYWVEEKELFTEPLKTPTGETYTATVPVQQNYEFESNQYGQGSVTPSLSDLETTEEEIRLETLTYKWQNRQVSVTIEHTSPYTQADRTREVIDLWLPPRAISLAFQQLDELAASLNFLADAKDELPTWGFEEVEENADQ